MKNLLCCLLTLLLAHTARAQAVAWELSAETGSQVSSVATVLGANFNNAVLTRGSGITAASGAGSMNASGWFSGTTATTLADAIAGNDFYEFTVNSINCNFFNPTSIRIVLRSSATGPGTATLRSSSDGFTANIGTVTVGTTSAEFTFSETVSPNSQSVTYRLYGYGAAAGGGTPSAGGTMRIGSSVTAGDNDLEVFATSTTPNVSQVANITVNSGNFVPATVFTANIPGATVNWSRTPESIGLGATAGTGDLPAFTASNNTGAPVTSMVTVNATAGACTSANMTFTITVNPPGCTITAVFSGSAGPCNDNGTPADPSDDFFTQNIQASFFNRPFTGSLQIVPGGDQIGVYSIPVNQIIGNQHIFNNVQFKADGTPSVIELNFTDAPACIDEATGPTVQPCSTPPPACTITANFSGSAGPCNDNGTPADPSDDFFTQNIQASFFNRPLTGSLQIVPGGDQIGSYSIPVSQIIGNQHIFTNVQFKADGTPTVIQLNFTAAPACIDAATGPTVQPCSNAASCEIIGYSFANIDPCNANGTPSDPSDDFFTVDVEVLYSNPFSNANIALSGPDVMLPTGAAAAVGANLSTTIANVRIRADGQITDLLGEIENSAGVPQCSLPGTGPSVGSCSSAPPPCVITGLQLINPEPCDDNGTPDDPTDDFYVADVLVSFEFPPATGFLVVSGADLVDGDFQVTIANVLANGSPFGFGNKRFRADGQSTSITAQFTGAAGCIASISTITGVDPCSFPAPVLTCPPPVTVSCASNVPPPNPASVAEMHACPGSVTITAVVPEQIVGQVCPNRFTVQRVYQATDGCGNVSSCSQTITVNDQAPPAMTCPPNVTVACAGNVPAANVAAVTGLGDNCGGSVTVFNFPSDVVSNQTCINRFTIARSYFAVDACGNSSNCIQTITVNDQTPPAMTCPPNVTVACAGNVPAANVAAVTGLGDNCGGTVTVTNFPSDVVSNQTCANRFTIARSYFAVDACGNSSNCIQTITVNDQTPPAMTCPAPQTVSCAENLPAPNVALVTGVSDNCGGVPAVIFVNDVVGNQTCANRFTVTRQYRATDVCGNSATCLQLLTVNDQTAPAFTAVPANTTVDCFFVPLTGNATATDNCNAGASVAFLGEVQTPGVCPVFYTLTRTWRATDACGNSATATQVVTVTDTNAPQFLVLPQNTVVECGPNNAAEFQAFLDTHGGAVAEDCAPFTVSHADSPVQLNNGDCGATFRKNIRFTATDQCGNASFHDASFTVVDLTPPVFTVAPQNVELECDASGDNGETAFYDWLDNNAGLVVADACGTVSLEKALVNETQGCGNTWQKTYQFRATDGCGNQAITTATFATVDHTPPVLTCPPNDGLSFSCLEDVPAADPSALTAWDCSGVALTLVDTWTNGTGCPDWPMTVAHRYAATDGCGNQAICERAFVVEETDMPTLTYPDTIELVCVDDIPGPQQLFAYIKSQLTGDCAGGFTGIAILDDSGRPENGASHRTYTFIAKNRCGLITAPATVTFTGTDACNELCTAPQASWGDPDGIVGAMNTGQAIDALIQAYGAPMVGGGNHTVTASDALCVEEMLFGAGNMAFLPIGQHTCPLPASLANADGSLNNQLAANALALQLNIWYNRRFNDRDLGIQDLQYLPPCLVEYPVLKELGQHSTVQDVLNLTNLYLQGVVGSFSPDLPALLNAALDNLNYFRQGCAPNAPCELAPPIQNRGAVTGAYPGPRLFPNPATDAATLHFRAESDGTARLTVTDARGQQTQRIVPVARGLNAVEISLQGLPPGVYRVAVQCGEWVGTVRMVKVGE